VLRLALPYTAPCLLCFTLILACFALHRRISPFVAASCTAVYNVWAKYRTQITGREALDVILARHKAEQQGKTGSLCRDADGNVAAACDLPSGSGGGSSAQQSAAEY
jgi:hypothetical protein